MPRASFTSSLGGGGEKQGLRCVLTALMVIPGANRGSVKFLLLARVSGPRTVFRSSSWKSIAALEVLICRVQ